MIFFQSKCEKGLIYFRSSVWHSKVFLVVFLKRQFLLLFLSLAVCHRIPTEAFKLEYHCFLLPVSSFRPLLSGSPAGCFGHRQVTMDSLRPPRSRLNSAGSYLLASRNVSRALAAMMTGSSSTLSSSLS